MTISQAIKKIIDDNLSTVAGLTIHTHEGMAFQDFLQNVTTSYNTGLVVKLGWSPGEEAIDGFPLVKVYQFVIYLNLIRDEDNEVITDSLEDIMEVNYKFTANGNKYQLTMTGATTPFVDSGVDMYELDLNVIKLG